MAVTAQIQRGRFRNLPDGSPLVGVLRAEGLGAGQHAECYEQCATGGSLALRSSTEPKVTETPGLLAEAGVANDR
ncbi:hypothetical protein FHX37_1708 [Haloactinospora alba]|uniref:Uncharacterized protein n=1 Tax=Haloactinospora alba TaxID=405555 RepID=A0A543NIW9_9ACTN|nr:hypothetical protein FHX37_1708 [Haloactinospora alba]